MRFILIIYNSFEKLNKIASGTFSNVYAGIMHGKEVAIKQQNPEQPGISYIQYEADIYSLLDDHPRIVKLISFTKSPSSSLIFEMAPLGDLKTMLRKYENRLQYAEERQEFGNKDLTMIILIL